MEAPGFDPFEAAFPLYELALGGPELAVTSRNKENFKAKVALEIGQSFYECMKVSELSSPDSPRYQFNSMQFISMLT